MKAFRLHEFGGPGSLKLEEIPKPTPGPGEILLRVRAVSLNYRDLMIAKGIYNPKLRLPLIPLSDGGEVVATGSGATASNPANESSRVSCRPGLMARSMIQPGPLWAQTSTACSPKRWCYPSRVF